MIEGQRTKKYERRTKSSVLIPNMNTSNWDKRRINKKLLEPRSYIVELENNGKTYRRNAIAHTKQILKCKRGVLYRVAEK